MGDADRSQASQPLLQSEGLRPCDQRLLLRKILRFRVCSLKAGQRFEKVYGAGGYEDLPALPGGRGLPDQATGVSENFSRPETIETMRTQDDVGISGMAFLSTARAKWLNWPANFCCRSLVLSRPPSPSYSPNQSLCV